MPGVTPTSLSTSAGSGHRASHQPGSGIPVPSNQLCSALKRPIYGVLGNHDTIRMVPGLEDMGIQMLLNENLAIERGNQRIYLAGIDDAHFYRVDNIEKAATEIPPGYFSILLSPRPRFTSKHPMLILAYSWAATLMAAKSAFPVAFRSP